MVKTSKLHLLVLIATMVALDGWSSEDACAVVGRQVTCQSPNFKLAIPRGWQWSEIREKRNPLAQQYVFVAKRESTDTIMIIVRRLDLYANSQKDVRQYLEGLQRGVEQAGGKVLDLQHAPISLSAGRGWSYRYTMDTPSGEAFADGVILGAGRLYIFQYVSAAREQLPAFNSIVASFQLLDTAARPPTAADVRSTFANLAFVLYGVLFIIGWGSAKLVNRIVRRRLVNTALVGTLFLIPLFVFQLVLILKMSDSFVGKSPEKQGELVGYMLGPGLFAFLVGGGVAIAESRRAARAA